MADYELSQEDKKVLQMTREGLTEENAVTGESRNISHKEADYEYHGQEEVEEAYEGRRAWEEEEESGDNTDTVRTRDYQGIIQSTGDNRIQDIIDEYHESLIEKEIKSAKQYEHGRGKEELKREGSEKKEFRRDSVNSKRERFQRDVTDGKTDKFKRDASFSGDRKDRKSRNHAGGGRSAEGNFCYTKRRKYREQRLKFTRAETARLQFEKQGAEREKQFRPPVNTKLTAKRLWNSWSESRRKQRDLVTAEMATDIRKGLRHAKLIRVKWKKSTGIIKAHTSPEAKLKRREEKERYEQIRRDEYDYKYMNQEKRREQRRLKKHRVKKRYQKAAIKRNMLQNQQRILQNRNFITKVKDRVVRVVKAVKTTMSLIAASMTILIILSLVLLGGGFLLAICIGYGGDAIIESTYQADYSQISDCSSYMRQLETELEEKIGKMEEEYPDCYEYIYELGEIGHDSIELMSYLAAKFVEFNLPVCQSEMDAIFEEMYLLTVDIVQEPREREKVDALGNVIYDGDGNPVMEEFVARICYVTLEVKELKEIIEARLEEEQKKYFNTYMLSSGGQQVYLNCLPDVEWGSLISSKFGERIHPITKERTFHNGIDIAVPVGTSLYSSTEGTVTVSAYSETAGNYIIVTMENGWIVKYMHLDSRSVSAGQKVLKGQFLGETGNTGRSTGPHLHLEVRSAEPDSKPMDPTFLIPSHSVTISNNHE